MGEEQEVKPGEGGGQPPAAAAAPETWEAWLAAQPEDARKVVAGLYDTHTQGLRSALESERAARRDLAKKLQEATPQLEAGSKARTELEQVSAQLTEAQRRADFFDDAAKPEVGCSNPRLAYLAAKESGAWDHRGNVNWTQLKESYPELFQPKRAATPPSANAGSGNKPPATFDMNQALRAVAGRNNL